jgi:hypothetical protein
MNELNSVGDRSTLRAQITESIEDVISLQLYRGRLFPFTRDSSISSEVRDDPVKDVVAHE